MSFTRRFDRLTRHLADKKWPKHELEDASRKILEGLRKDLIDELQQKPNASLEQTKARLITFFDQLGAGADISEGTAQLECDAARNIMKISRVK